VTGPEILLDEHVGRIFERVLSEHGYEVGQAKDVFGEQTEDARLLKWCGEHGVTLITNNARDFEELHQEIDHSGLLLYHEQNQPDVEPEAFARVVDEVFSQYGVSGVENEIVALDEWYDWLHC
jgi:hypothetical protein